MSAVTPPFVYSQKFTTTDVYQYLQCPFGKLVTLQVTNAAIYIGFGYGGGDSVNVQYPSQDEIFLPSFAGIERRTDQVRIKSYALGTPAVVVVTVRNRNPA